MTSDLTVHLALAVPPTWNPLSSRKLCQKLLLSPSKSNSRAPTRSTFSSCSQQLRAPGAVHSFTPLLTTRVLVKVADDPDVARSSGPSIYPKSSGNTFSSCWPPTPAPSSSPQTESISSLGAQLPLSPWGDSTSA